jgi:cyclase
MRQVSANVYIECDLHGCNLGFVTTREGLVMIDTPLYPTDAIKWRDVLGKHGELKYVINTDPHPDHNSGNYFFPSISISHREGREALLSRNADQILGIVRYTDPEGVSLMEGYQVKLPDITFTERLDLHLGDHSFRLIHLPGHAPGVVAVHIPEEGVVFASDIVFYREKSYLNEATPSEWIRSLTRLGELGENVIVPGHGEDTCSKDYLHEQAGIIRGWVEAVRKAISEGLTPEEAAAKIQCPDPYHLPERLPWTESDLDKMIINRLYQVVGP